MNTNLCSVLKPDADQITVYCLQQLPMLDGGKYNTLILSSAKLSYRPYKSIGWQISQI